MYGVLQAIRVSCLPIPIFLHHRRQIALMKIVQDVTKLANRSQRWRRPAEATRAQCLLHSAKQHDFPFAVVVPTKPLFLGSARMTTEGAVLPMLQHGAAVPSVF